MTASDTGYVLTQHARDALAKRGIALAWMERVLEHPQWLEPDPVDGDLEHCLAAVPEFGNRVLRVIVNRATAPQRIVTAYFDRPRTKP